MHFKSLFILFEQFHLLEKWKLHMFSYIEAEREVQRLVYKPASLKMLHNHHILPAPFTLLQDQKGIRVGQGREMEKHISAFESNGIKHINLA